MIPEDRLFRRIVNSAILVLLLVFGLMIWGNVRGQAMSYGQYSEEDKIGRWVMFSPFSQQEAYEFNKFVNFLIGAEAHILEIQLSNGGGDLFPALSMIDNIRLLQANGIGVITRATGLCASACALLWSYGNKRVVGASSWIMFHSLSSSLKGSQTLHEIVARADFLERLQGQINSDLAERLEIEPSVITEIMKVDTWLSAGQALELGFATHIE